MFAKRNLRCSRTVASVCLGLVIAGGTTACGDEDATDEPVVSANPNQRASTQIHERHDGAPDDGEDHAARGIRVVNEVQVRDRIVDLTVESRALGGERVKVRLLTPDGWERRDRSTAWPVLFLLHGATDTHEAWTERWSQGGIATWPELRDTLVVMPAGGEVGWYSNWWNDGGGGPPAWETFHLDELRLLLEDDYGAGPRRAIAGLSMGGFGAVSYAARRPGMFDAAASFSGPVHTTNERFETVLDALSDALGTDLDQLWGDRATQRGTWQAHDPYHLADRLGEIPVYLSSGNGKPGPLDPSGTAFDDNESMILQWNRETASRLEQAGVRLTTNFYGAGGHHPAYAERELREALPLLQGDGSVGVNPDGRLGDGGPRGLLDRSAPA